MLSSFFGTLSSLFSVNNSLPAQSESGPSTSVASSSNSHLAYQETIPESNLFAECVNFINDRNYEDLYNFMLFNTANLWVNELNPETQENILHHATLANDNIAFDIVMLFGAKIDSNWLTILLQKTNASGVLLTADLYDRIISILSNTYTLPEKADIFDTIPAHLRNRLTKFSIEGLTLHYDPDFIKKTPENFFNALDVIAMNSAFIELIKDATIARPYIVQFASNQEMVFYGECDQTHHIIRIQREIIYPEILLTLIFELCNAANNEFYKIQPRDYSNRDDYAYACERSEYNSLLRYYEVIENLLIDGGLEAFHTKNGNQTLAHYFRRNALDLKFNSFEQCFERQNTIIPPRTMSHTDHYRQHYDYYQAFMKIILNETLDNAPDIEPTSSEPTTQPVIFSNIHLSEYQPSSQLPTQEQRSAPTLSPERR